MIEFDKLSNFFKEIHPFENTTKELYLDLHMHTYASDGFNKEDFLINFLKNKEHLISITDHNEIRGATAIENKGINNVPGIELGFIDGFELLVYFKTIEELEEFYIKEVEPHKHRYRMARTNKDVFYFLDLLKEWECHISIPHINGLAQKNFLKNKNYIKDILTRVDSVETYNHTLTKGRNLTAKKIRKHYHLDATFGSDAHINREIKSYYRFLNEEERKHHKLVDTLYKLPMISGIGQKHLFHALINKR